MRRGTLFQSGDDVSDATAYAFLSSQPQGSQLVHEDLEQIHDDDLEEMDLKWNMALLSMRARKFYQRTGRKIIIDGNSTAGYDKSKRYLAPKSCLEEFQQPEINWYGPRNSSSKPTTVDTKWKEKFFNHANNVRLEEPKKASENTDAPIIEDWVSDDEEEVESTPKVEKKIPTATKEASVNIVKPSRRTVM
ncbi:hypothetical protein Tco_0874317 [Tanacetum coccineum]|uniref:Uncharacterized protein n=1 Tax=Tanacetum coccineum TaxID=301880 RepID=A0ABQ5BLM5_9ASTR